MKPENIRTKEELENTYELKDLKYEFSIKDNIIFAIPKTEINKWMFRIFYKTIKSFSFKANYNKYHIHDHKKLVNFMRRLYNQFPIVFGYSVRHPLDEIDNEFGQRIALERLVTKIKNPYWNQ